MARKANILKNFAAIAAVAAGCAFWSLGAAAAPGAGDVAGCDPKVLNAMNAKAKAVVAYKVAATEQFKYKNDSVLFMTCFNSAAGNSAKWIGEIFSGDFTAGLQPIVEDALPAFSDDYERSIGTDFGLVDYNATTMNTNMTSCLGIKDLWQKYIDEPVRADIPYPTYEDMFTGNMPTGLAGAPANDTNFYMDWEAAKNVDTDFDDLKTSIDDPANGLRKTDMTKKPDGSGLPPASTAPINRTCEIMFNYGVTGSAACP
jgi:hypothetical protein